MKKDPAFLFYSSDFLAGVSDMTMEERGQYITLLCTQHQKGHISSKWLSINLPNASSDVLSKFEADDEGNLTNGKLSQLIQERKTYKPYKIASACLGGLLSSRKDLTTKQKQYIKSKFNINDFIDLGQDEIK